MLLQWYYCLFRWYYCSFRVLLKCSERCYSGEQHGVCLMGQLFIHCVTEVFWTCLQWWTTLSTVLWDHCLFTVLLKCSERCYRGEQQDGRLFSQCVTEVFCCYNGTSVYSVCSEVLCCYSGTAVIPCVTEVFWTLLQWWELFIPCVTEVFCTLLQWWATRWTVPWVCCLFSVPVPPTPAQVLASTKTGVWLPQAR